MQRATVDGASLEAMVTRGAGASLPSTWAPDDLVEIPSLAPISARQCALRGAQCLRRTAAAALISMLSAMRRDGVAGLVHSTFRSYGVQCTVFANWAYGDDRGFCRAAKGSALPGHSQHQLGTTLDLLTVQWRAAGRGLSADFGCSAGGRWLATHAESFGFVLPYPLFVDHRDGDSACRARGGAGIDPRTGYTYEPWHLRYIGTALAREFAEARAQSGIGTPTELTLDQWLRRRAGRVDDGDLPVCDGCSCGACSTLEGSLEREARPPCPANEMLVVRADGTPVSRAQRAPRLLSVDASRARDGAVEVRAMLSIEPGTLTQTPVPTNGALRFDAEQHSDRWTPSSRSLPRAYRDLPGAYRLAISTSNDERYRYRVGLSNAGAATAYNGAVLYLPASTGAVEIRVLLAERTTRLRVALWIDGRAIEPREVLVR